MAEAPQPKSIFTADEKSILQTALIMQGKSFERAARSSELMGRKAIAESIRSEQAILAKLKVKVDAL